MQSTVVTYIILRTNKKAMFGGQNRTVVRTGNECHKECMAQRISSYNKKELAHVLRVKKQKQKSYGSFAKIQPGHDAVWPNHGNIFITQDTKKIHEY